MDVEMTGGVADKWRRARKTTWLALVLPSLVITLGACAQKESGTGNPLTTASSSASQAPSEGDDGEQSAFETPGDAVKSFVTQVLSKQYVKACLATAPAGEVSEEERQRKCNSEKAKKTLSSLRGMWAKPGVKLPPKAEVEVTEVAAKGDAASVPDTAVKLDGRTLRELELIGSSGDTESFSFSLELQKVDDSWHVVNWNIEF